MADTTKIEWCDMTFNAWIGCTKVSPGCANCYAERLNNRMMWCVWGPTGKRQRTSEANWRKPLAWDRRQHDLVCCADLAGQHPPRRPRVFCASLADWLDPEVPIEWLADLLDLIRRTPHLDWLLLTKRPQLWKARIEAVLEYVHSTFSKSDTEQACFAMDWLEGKAPANVWIGTTVEDQQRADERISALLKIPARVRFLSCEPLLGPVDLGITRYGVDEDGKTRCRCGDPECGVCSSWKSGIHWVICGGESGPKARPMHPEWARSLRDQCAEAGVPFLFKQWGEWLPNDQACPANCKRGLETMVAGCETMRVGKHAAGRLLDGREHNQFPEVAHA